MIAVCEPQCTGSVHEAVNSAFLQGLRLAFPAEKIIFFADPSHIDAVQKMFATYQVEIENIEYRPIKVRQLRYFTFSATFQSYFLFKHLFNELTELGIRKLVLLSISSDGLYAIKLLATSISCYMALHGVFEWITDGPYNPFRSALHRYFFNFKRALEWRHSNNLHYIALSPHALGEANKYVDVARHNISAIYLPFMFSRKKHEAGENGFVRFATIGQGSPEKVKYIANALNSKPDLRKYEIRIIGELVSGVENIKNVDCVSPRKRLTRDQIGHYINDVDVLLMLYEKDAYKLTCSGALLEAFSYVKPMIFLNNVCVNYFNTLASGNIGYECQDLDEVIAKMECLINDPNKVKPELEEMRNNIVALRNKIDIVATSQRLAEIIGKE